MDDFNKYENEQSDALISKFDRMLRKGEHYFFDVEEFEIIIDSYLFSQQYDKTNIAIKYALEQHPKTVSIKLKKAQLLVSSNHINKALDLLSEVERMEPKNPEVFMTKAGIYSQLKRYEKAIEEYNKAINDAVDLEEVYTNIAFEYENLGKYDKAIEYLKKVLDINPENEAVVYELSFCFEISNNTKDSVAYFEKFLDRNPYSKSSWFNLGIAYNNNQLYEKAIEAYDYAIAIDESFSSHILIKQIHMPI